jgi:alpha-L-arabinofuranosidase
VQIDLQGVPSVKKDVTGQMITGELGGINTVAEPMKLVPKPVNISISAPKFAHELPAHSVSVLRVKTK